MVAADTEIPAKGFDLQQLSDALVRHAESAIIGTSLEGEIVYWNRGAEMMYGYTAGEAIGTEYTALMPADRRDEFNRVMEMVMHGSRVPAYDTVRAHKDGSLVDIHLGVHPVTDARGSVVGICTIAMDITRLKRTERELQTSKSQVEAVVETVLDGIVTINEVGVIESVNPATERIFGYAAHEMTGRNVKMLMPEPYHSEHDGYLHNYVTTGRAKIIGIGREVQGRRKDGSTFPIDLAVTEMSVGGRRAFVGILRDITERKKDELALHKLNRRHERKVRELEAALEQLQATQAQLVQSEKLASLGGLVAGIAHEINTPVGICVTAASYLQDRTNDVLDKAAGKGALSEDDLNAYLAKASEATQMIMNNLNRAAQLISSFKHVAVDRSSNELRQFDFRSFMDDVINSLNPVLKRRGHEVKLSFEGDTVLQTYPGALSQIVTNLMMNAVTHAYKDGEKGCLSISSYSTESEFEMRFKDDGCGIPVEVLKKIFDPFYTTARGQGGTGLGLHVVHNLATEVLGGSIRVESAPGQGTSFILKIPKIKEPDISAMTED